MKWYETLQQDVPTFRQVFQRPNNSTYFVRDVQHKPEVLDIHSHLSSITNVPNGAYYKLQLTKNNKDDNPWIPLLPGYTIFTTCAGHYVKMSIDKDQEGQLWFCWTDYDNDASFLREYAIGRDQAMFSSLRDHLNLEGTYSVPSLSSRSASPGKWTGRT
jgi:hypothetical protein